MSITTLKRQLAEFRALAAGPQLQRDAPFSAWCVAEHVDHCIRVSGAALAFVLAAKPQSETLSLIGRVILTIGWIPRGRGKAPEKVRGTRKSAEEVAGSLGELDRTVAALAPASFADRETRVMRHPYFGGLTAEQTLRFVVIHNRHHLKIIRDILRTSPQAGPPHS